MLNKDTNEQQINKLEDLLNRFTKHSRHMSSPSQVKSLSEYAEICECGKEIIPYIKERLIKSGSVHLMMALHDILKEKPEIPSEHFGKVKILTTYWLDFLTKKGY